MTCSIYIRRGPLRELPEINNTYVLDRGIIFYVYSENQCKHGIRYIPEVLTMARYIKSLDLSVVYFSISLYLGQYCCRHQLQYYERT